MIEERNITEPERMPAQERGSRRIDPTTVPGWGIDADPQNDPTYPMRRRDRETHEGYNWERPTQQPQREEVLHSNERPNLSAVYGTSTPPAGLSGMLRRAAFNYSESHYGHWLPLMLADRIGVFEGMLDDVVHGHVPNVFVERGGRAVWQHNRQGMLTGIALGAALGACAVLYYRSKRQDSHG